MKICTEAVQVEVSLVERPEEPWPHPPVLPATAEAYWRSLYERERSRAEAAEALCEELRWKEVDSRARAGTLKWQFDKCRKKLAASTEKRWGRLRGLRHLADVITDVRFIDGVNEKETGREAAELKTAIHNI